MQICFFIGNGFDIQSGLKTRYSDFYNFLKEKSKEDKSIKENIIYKDIEVPENAEKWSDFEMGLMELTQSCVPDDENIDGITTRNLAEAKEQIEIYLGEYLKQLNTFDVKKYPQEVKKIFKNSFDILFRFLPLERRDELDRILNFTSPFNVNIIDFNYTSLFKDVYRLLDSKNFAILSLETSNNRRQFSLDKGNYIKIHGEILKNMNLGGSDDSQLGQIMKESNEKYYFIKSELDREIGNGNYTKTISLINGSSLFCIFGMSLGETDKCLWSNILKCMIKNKNSAVLIFQYDPNKSINNLPYKRKNKSDSIKTHFLQYIPDIDIEERNSLFSRIFIVFNSNLFNLHELLNKKEVHAIS